MSPIHPQNGLFRVLYKVREVNKSCLSTGAAIVTFVWIHIILPFIGVCLLFQCWRYNILATEYSKNSRINRSTKNTTFWPTKIRRIHRKNSRKKTTTFDQYFNKYQRTCTCNEQHSKEKKKVSKDLRKRRAKLNILKRRSHFSNYCC